MESVEPDLTVVERWGSREFADELRAWVEGEIGPVRELTELKTRPWSTVWRVESDHRAWYAKQNCPGQLFEAALLAELAQVAPGHVLPVEAVDAERGFILTPDQGPVFADSVSEDDLEPWCRLVTTALEMGRAVAPYADRLVAAGLTRPSVPDEVADLVTPWQEVVTSLGLPETVSHNDLHEQNAFHRHDGLLLFDFADAVLADPLADLRVPLDILADRFGAGPDDPRLWRVANAGLEVWSDVVPLTELRRALPAALCLSRLGRYESWRRILPDLSAADLADHGGNAQAWLDRLPHPPPVGSPPGAVAQSVRAEDS